MKKRFFGFVIFILLMLAVTSWEDVSAAALTKKYTKTKKSPIPKLLANHKSVKKKTKHRKAKQPKYYAKVNISYPLYIDITNRGSGKLSGLPLSKPQKKPFYHLAVGMSPSFNEQLAFEVEAIYYRGKSSRNYIGSIFDIKLQSISLLGNAYYIFDGWKGFEPFVGVGLGASFNKIHDYTIFPPNKTQPEELSDKSHTALAYQAMVGVNKDLTQNVSVQALVRAMSLGQFSDGSDKGRFNAVALSGSLGLKYSFSHIKNIKKQRKKGEVWQQ